MSSLSTVAQVVVAASNVKNLYDSTQQSDSEMGPGFKKIDILVKSAVTALELASLGAAASGSSNSIQLRIKTAQLVGASCNFPLELLKGMDRADKDGFSHKQFWLKGVVAPALDVIRITSQAVTLGQKGNIELYKNDPNATYPVYRGINCTSEGCDDYEIVGYKPIDLEECEQIIKNATKVDEFATCARIAVDAHVN